jgi:Zn-dependent protease
MVRDGFFLVLGRWKGALVRVHLLAPLVPLVWPGRPVSTGWIAGFLLVVLAHEFGHGVLVRLVGAHVVRIDLLPTGGECWHTGTDSELKDSIIAWGGVLGQLVLAIPADIWLASGPPAEFVDFLWALSGASLVLAGVNLLPIPPLDGAKAWRLLWLFPIWAISRVKRRKRRGLARSKAPPTPGKQWLN